MVCRSVAATDENSHSIARGGSVRENAPAATAVQSSVDRTGRKAKTARVLDRDAITSPRSRVMRIDTGKARARHLLLPAVLLMLNGHALAEPPADAQRETPTTYAFDDDKVLGETVGAMGEVIVVREHPARASLIRVRDSFVRELLKAVETL
jgi:hypothetical protein